MRSGFGLKPFSQTRKVAASRLLIAACLAYIWIVYLGALCEQDGWGRIIQRGDRCDLSLFQLGLRLLDYVLNEDLAIPVAFCVSI
jgi:hypothetical protein